MKTYHHWSGAYAIEYPEAWNLKTTPKRMAQHGDDFAGVLGPGIDVEALFQALATRLEEE